MAWLIIGIGGGIGAMARHAVNQVWLGPTGTAVVNVSGCLIIGLLAGLIAADRIVISLYWRQFVFVGLLGGYTTFSTFGLDTFMLARTQPITSSLLNVGVQVIGGLVAVWAGYQIGAAGR